MPDGAIGTPIRRREDQRFLTGTGQYVDDVNRPGQTTCPALPSAPTKARRVRIIPSASKAVAKPVPSVLALR